MGPPPASSQDLEHLKLLSLFHYILAGITALFSCFPILHIAFGIMIATGNMGEAKNQTGPSPETFGWIFAAIGCAAVAAGWTLAILLFAGGRNIAKRRRHTFCLVVAGLSCLMMPLGTVLGVFTLVVLMRPQVKALFGAPQ